MREKALEFAVGWVKEFVPPSQNFTSENVLEIARAFEVYLAKSVEIPQTVYERNPSSAQGTTSKKR